MSKANGVAAAQACGSAGSVCTARAPFALLSRKVISCASCDRARLSRPSGRGSRPPTSPGTSPARRLTESAYAKTCASVSAVFPLLKKVGLLLPHPAVSATLAARTKMAARSEARNGDHLRLRGACELQRAPWRKRVQRDDPLRTSFVPASTSASVRRSARKGTGQRLMTTTATPRMRAGRHAFTGLTCRSR